VPSAPPPSPTLRPSRPPPPVAASGGSRFAAGAIVAGGYRLLHTLGRGGSGEVWCAIADATGTHVAIKLHDEPDEEAAARALERLREEARVVAAVAATSQRVVRVLDVGVDGAVPFLVMERVNGRTLAQELDRVGVLAPARFAALFAQVAEAVAALHAAGFVHGDLKPANLLLHGGPAGPFIKVADFGVASALGRGAPEPDAPPGFVVGSPAYMSPEQLAGAPLDARTDVWSLGVVAYEALTGWPPFGAPSVPALVDAIATRPHVPASQRRAGLPPALVAWIDRALAKRPDGRFDDVPTMAAALESAIAGLAPTPAPDPVG
jgi:serine/threonine-protein kinase